MVIILRHESEIKTIPPRFMNTVKIEGDMEEGWQEKILATGTCYSDGSRTLYSKEQLEEVLGCEGFIVQIRGNQRQ